MDYRIIQLEEKITQNLKLDWNVEKMAEIAEVSKEHFQKIFKSSTQETPIQFLKRLRLEKAKELLETMNSRISEILYEVGIKDIAHFVRDFKEAYGFTPNKYRQDYWEKVRKERLKNQNN